MPYSFPMIVPVAYILLFLRLMRPYYAFKSLILRWLWGVKANGNVRFMGSTIIRTRHRGEIVLGDGVSFDSRRLVNSAGLLGPTMLETIYGGKITVGDHSGFSSVIISSRCGVTIGSYVKVGANVRIYDHDFHSRNWFERRLPKEGLNAARSPVEIGNDVFIGANTIILKGTRIGDRSVIAAGSVLMNIDVPSDSTVVGNPAKVIRRKSEEEAK